MTQGDRLNQIKAKKQAASCGNVPVEKLKGHVRVKSVPSRTLVNNSNNNSGSGSAATTSAALSPSRPLTRMQAEAVAAASGKNQVCLIKSVPSRNLVNNSNNNSGSGSVATTSAALSPSRPLTRMQAEAVAAASGKNQVCLILSNELLHSEDLSNGGSRTIKNPPSLAVKEKRTFRVSAL